MIHLNNYTISHNCTRVILNNISYKLIFVLGKMPLPIDLIPVFYGNRKLQCKLKSIFF